MPRTLRPACALAVLVLSAACTPAASTAPTSGVPGSGPPTTSRTSTSPVPVTTNGLITGPGVDDTSITLGLLDPPGRDRGFAAGVRLWQQSVNSGGGICGRTVDLQPATGTESATATYTRLGLSVLGFLAPTAEADLTRATSGDGITVLAATGSSAALAKGGPIPLGATEDIEIINGLAYLASDQGAAARPTDAAATPTATGLVVVTDGSATSANGAQGARWWADRQKIDADLRSTPTGSWTGVRTAVVLGGPELVRAALLAAPPAVAVLTTVDGWDPAQVPAEATGRLFVTLPTPPFGSDQPAAAAVARAFRAATPKDTPGPRVLAGYGVGAEWGRVLGQACTNGTLTRAGVSAALAAVGPSAVDSLFGSSNPALVVGTQLPATRESSVAMAAPAEPGGLAPLLWLQAASGIGDYQPHSE